MLRKILHLTPKAEQKDVFSKLAWQVLVLAFSVRRGARRKVTFWYCSFLSIEWWLLSDCRWSIFVALFDAGRNHDSSLWIYFIGRSSCAPWEKKPGVEIIDPKGDFLNTYLDVTLPALFQPAAKSIKAIHDAARRAKSKAYPRKDIEGRLLNTSCCSPFFYQSWGASAQKVTNFFAFVKRNLTKAKHMLDVLVTQHSRWTARHLHRSLFGQCLIKFFGSCWTPGASLSRSPGKINYM